MTDFDNMNETEFKKLSKKEFDYACMYFGVKRSNDKKSDLTNLMIAQYNKGQNENN